MIKFLTFLAPIFLTIQLYAQVVTSDPNFPLDTDQVTITFDASKGTAGLSGFTGDIYAHTGVITENSGSSSDWKYVKTNWGQNTPETKLTRVSGDIYTLTISPSIRQYYNVPDGEQILKMAFVFRSADATKEGKGDGGSDIFVDLNTGFTLQVNSPSSRYDFYSPNDVITLSASVPEEANFTYYLDDEVITESTGTDFSITHTVLDDQLVHELLVIAISVSEGDSLGFSHSYIVNPQTVSATQPAGLIDGINYASDPSQVSLLLTAPNKQNIFVLGDFNNWTLNTDFQMYQDGEQFWLTIDGLVAGKEYIFQYLIDGSILIADPYTEKVISQFDDSEIISTNRYPGLIPYPSRFTEQEASVIQTNKPEYPWEVTDFVRPSKEDLVIYELLVRDFTEDRTYQAVIDRLDYLDSLGINALQLMPVMEFEGNLSWGYNPSFMLAVDKFYGTEDELKLLIDECHKRGIAVILDIVLNHQFGRSPLVRMYSSGNFGPPTSSNPWFNVTAKHPFNVGYDMNHESQYTKDYVDRVVSYWVEEYKIDGYRFDLSKGFTQVNSGNNVDAWGQYDASRIALLKRMSDVIWSVDPGVYVILEHFGGNVEEAELADYGMMLWGNMNGTFTNTGFGLSSNLNWGYYKARGWNESGLIAYMESHDEERVFFEVGERSQETTNRQFQRLMQNAAFFFAIPGAKMIWQFGEFGYDLELNDDRLGIKPTKWEYLQDTARLRLFSVYQSMINLKTKTDYMDEQYFSWQSDGDMKWIKYDHPDAKIVMFGNFSRTPKEFTRDMMEAGTWYNYLTGQQVEIGSSEEPLTYGPAVFQIWTSTPLDNFIDWSPENFLLNLADKPDKSVQVYPNPTADYIYLSGSERLEYRIYDMNGKVMIDGKWNNETIDIRSLPQGQYLLVLANDQIFESHKIIRK